MVNTNRSNLADGSVGGFRAHAVITPRFTVGEWADHAERGATVAQRLMPKAMLPLREVATACGFSSNSLHRRGVGLLMLGLSFVIMSSVDCQAQPVEVDSENSTPRAKVEAVADASGGVVAPFGRIALSQPQTGYANDYIADDLGRWFLLRVHVENTTDKPLTILPECWQLHADDQLYEPASSRDPNAAPGMSPSLWLNGEVIELDSLQPETLEIEPRETRQTLLLFPRLPYSEEVPRLELHCLLPDTAPVQIKVQDYFADRLVVKEERLGPGRVLTLLTVSGELNVMTSPKLAKHLDKLVADGLVHIVVQFDENSSPPIPEGQNWLEQMAQSSGAQWWYDDAWPSVSTELMDLHFVHRPEEQSEATSVDSDSELTLDAEIDQKVLQQWEEIAQEQIRNVHATLDDALQAAATRLCESIPRAVVLHEIRHGDPRLLSAMIAHGSKQLADEDVSVLFSLLQHSERDTVRRSVLYALRWFGSRSAIDTLIEAARGDEEELSKSAIESLVRSPYGESHQRLVAVLPDLLEVRRTLAVKIMAAAPQDEFADLLLAEVKRPDSTIKVEVLHGLARLGHPQLDSVLRSCLESDDETLQDAAFNFMAEQVNPDWDQMASDWVLRTLETGHPTKAMKRWLMRTQDSRALPLLMKFAEPDSDYRSLVMPVILLIGDDQLLAQYANAFESLEKSEQKTVMRSLAATRKPRFYELARMVLNDPEAPLRNATLKLLATTESPQGLDMLRESLQACEDRKEARRICQALSKSGTPAARDVLKDAMTAGADAVRNPSRKALEGLYGRSPAQPFVERAAELTAVGEIDSALRVIETAIEIDPDQPQARYQRGNIVLRLEHPSREQLEVARDDFELFLQFEQAKSSEASTFLAIVHARLGDVDRALEVVESLREKFGEEAIYLYNVACVYGRAIESLEAGDPDDAAKERVRQFEEAAMTSLEAAVDAQLPEFIREWMQRDPDLTTIRRRADFQKRIAERWHDDQ